MKKRRDFTGFALGDLTALRVVREEKVTGGANPRIEKWWLCRCACGEEVAFNERTLTHGTRKDCGGVAHQHHNMDNNIGARHGRLVVIGIRRQDDGKPLRLCRCDCGTEKEIRLEQLRRGGTVSCGCYASERSRARRLAAPRKDPRERALTAVIAGYRINAKNRGFEWGLSRDEVRALIFSACHYCGSKPTNHAQYVDIPYNGIDRIDSGAGYVAGNVVTACKVCNIAKRDMTLDDFAEWIERIAAHKARTHWESLGNATSAAPEMKEAA